MDQPTQLAGEVWRIFQQANTHRELSGGARDLRHAQARQMTPLQSGEQATVELPDNIGLPTPYCGCDAEASESCDVCEAPLEQVCMASDAMDWCAAHDVFDSLAHKLALVKIADYTAAAESFYAPVGNKPAELHANPVVDVPQSEMESAASVFYEYIKNFLDENQVTVDEIPTAFNLSSMNDLVDDLSKTAREQLQQDIQAGLDKAEMQMESAFNRSKLMDEYLRVIDDTSHSPIGVLWFDEAYLTKDYSYSSAGLKPTKVNEPMAKRIDPCNVWFTDDWTTDTVGRAVFTSRQMTAGDLNHMHSLLTNAKLKEGIAELLDNNEHGYRMHSTQLFYDTMNADNGLYDVLICRGTFRSDMLKEVGVQLEDEDARIHQAEVWYSGGNVLYARLIPCHIEDYGVYTTSFRSFGNCIWGISLYDFVLPFAKLYEGAIRGVDSSVAKTSGSIIMLDDGVIDDVESILTRNPKTNHYELDLSGDTLLRFDSTDASLSPNWKGVPLQIQQLPSDLPNLIPTINLALQQIEIISGIPSIISTGQPDSSAVRTDGSYRTAHRSASKKIAALLKRSKDRVLFRVIIAFYRTLVDNGLLKGLPLDVYPEVLMDERLQNELSAQQASGAILQDLGPFMDRIPEATVNGLLNTYARSAHGIDYDIIPGANPVGNQTPAQPTGEI